VKYHKKPKASQPDVQYLPELGTSIKTGVLNSLRQEELEDKDHESRYKAVKSGAIPSSGTIIPIDNEYGVYRVLHISMLGHQISERRAVEVTVADAPLIISEQLEEIRAAFSLGVSDLTKIMGKTRPTIYKWLDTGDPDNPKMISYINLLHVLAREWNTYNLYSFPLNKLIYQVIVDGKSFFDLISYKSFNFSIAQESFPALLDLMRQKNEILNQAIEDDKNSSLSEEAMKINVRTITNSIKTTED